MLNNGLVEFSDSPWSSPVVLVKNKDNWLRFCVEYRKLNAETKEDNYPYPRIDDAFAGYEFFSSKDYNQAYHQLEIVK